MAELRSKRLAIVVQLAKKEEDSAADVFSLCQQALALEQKRLADIDEYYASYEETIASQRMGLHGDQLQHSRAFLAQLNVARTQQRNTIIQAESTFKRRQSEWQVLRLKHQSLLDYVERLRQEELAVLDKQAQSVSDDLAAQRFFRRR
ncbi:MAG: flagellar FliJ protein [Flavobacteriales bacterium]|jgi:flagellar FliJ protein